MLLGGEVSSLHPETPIDAADLLWALASLCGVQRVPFDARLLLQQFPPPLSLATMLRAVTALGLRFTRSAIPARKLRHGLLPVLMIARGGASARTAMAFS